MTRTQIGDLIASVVDALGRHDVAALSSFYAEDCVVESPFAGGETRGRAAVAEVYDAFLRSFPDLTLRADAPIIDGARVVVVGRLSGTHAGGFLGMPPTGRTVDFPCVFIFDLHDGRIVRERRVYDFTGLAVQVGAIKAKPA